MNTISATGVAAAVKTSFHEPADVVVFPVSEPSQTTQITSVNDDVLAGIELGEAEEVWYDSPGWGSSAGLGDQAARV